ncbi:hypothetical protein PTSG_00848 [Salpingoeca rosetta]|uniref:Peptidase M43 pregnancy-associated plasma-A domain-containing protein n=1 Tax=Salpingoeca rosetta (strain ATCC 50818 / BSB-021) TaxID=946362 RepID=F2TXN1_SALR5|nr:uncharacterized protein PTSG_00848 [Salpingoeca rosetta]EGD76140.1 hypothetical protein PTSG_00848 [Salpingoeca rosetta]|eukprot:XP_004998315.1 hypothetical protein PTSG_00848 [Salpingoeca rosetta]
MDAGGVLMRMTTVLALMAALMMMAIVTTTTMMTEAAPTCGFEQLAERGGRTRRDIVSGLTPTVDSRFAFPSDDSSADVAPSKCTVKDDVASIFGIGYSECYSPEVTAHYSNLESWPDTTLKVKFKTITNDTGTGFVTQDDFEHALGLLNSSYANAGISFTGDADFVASQTIFDSMVNTAGYTSSNLFGVLDPLSQVLGIDQDLETRDVHSYIVVLKLDMSEIVGVCVPETGMLSARAQVLKDASGVPDWWGNICFLDYRWFSVRGINALADARSNGLYTIHEMGHSLGLLHTFQAAAYKFANGACVAPDYVGSSCFAEDDSFENGDYIADTAVMVSSTVASPGGSIFDNATCMAGPRYPGHCNGNPFA